MKTYKIEITMPELKSLAWVADRYESARLLYDGMDQYCQYDDLQTDCTNNYDCATCPINLFIVSEQVAADYVNALYNEDGHQIIPPCIGGNLADKLILFYNQLTEGALQCDTQSIP